MAAMSRRASFLIGLATVSAGPAVLAANLGAAASAFGPSYVWRFLTWGRRENTVNDTFFPRRDIPVSTRPAPLPWALQPGRVERALGRGPLQRFMDTTQTQALLVAEHGRIVFEGYANGAGPATPLGSRSMAKSVLAMLVGAAIAEGRIAGIEAPMEALLPGVPGLAGSGVLLRHMLQMGGGLRFRGDDAPLGPLTAEPLWDGTRVAYFVPGLRRYLATARQGGPVGARFFYDDRSAQLVGWALERAFGTSLSQAVAERFWTPMGAEFPASWSLNSAGDGLEKSESGIDAAARDWLKLGQVVLNDGAGLLLPGWITEMTRPATPTPSGYYDSNAEVPRYPGLFYARLWWGWAREGGPSDAFMHGLYGQVVYVCRARGVVAVRLGVDYGGVDHWPALLRGMIDRMGPR